MNSQVSCINNKKLVRLIVPTLSGNEFYGDMANAIILEAGMNDIEVNMNLPRVSVSRNLHQPNEYLNVLKKININGNNEYLVVVPANPSFHDDIKKITNLRNVITLDMEGDDSTLQDNIFLGNIYTDNEAASKLAAKSLADLYDNYGGELNLAIIDGGFHERGKVFLKSFTDECKIKMNVSIGETCWMDGDFGHARSSGFEFGRTLKGDGVPGLIYCANDNFALGVRDGLIDSVNSNWHIFAFDGSTTVREYIKMGDKYIKYTHGQNYAEIARSVIDIVAGNAPKNKKIRIQTYPDLMKYAIT